MNIGIRSEGAKVTYKSQIEEVKSECKIPIEDF